MGNKYGQPLDAQSMRTVVRVPGVECEALVVWRELASHNIQVNAIAQNYVENPNYFPPELIAAIVPGSRDAAIGSRGLSIGSSTTSLSRASTESRRTCASPGSA